MRVAISAMLVVPATMRLSEPPGPGSAIDVAP
jgi:hypothetical protein